MAKIAIVADSSACLPEELLEQFRITIVPLGLLIDGQPYVDGSLSPSQFYRRLRLARSFPSTTAPPPGAFLAAYKQLAQRADAVLCITLSSRFSGTHSSAVTAAELAQEELPGFPIHVLDSHSLAMSYGFAVLAAAAQDGLNAAIKAAQDASERSLLFGVLDTLRYLAKSGRVPTVAYWASSLLQIKPILMARGEEIKALERVRTRQRAIDRLLSHARQHIGEGPGLGVAVMHADAAVEAQALADDVRHQLRPQQLLFTEFTPVMGIHVGPGFLGLALYRAAPGSKATAAGAGKAREDDADPPMAEDVRRIEASLAPLPPPQPTPALVVVSGLPGSGKSHFTRELCQRVPLARLESDALRKALFDRPTHGPEESARLFAACHQVLDRLLAAGIPTVLDATNLRELHRRKLYRIAEKNGAKLVLVSLDAPPEVVRQRLETRQRGDNPWDHSDADPSVYDRMRPRAEPIRRPHISVDTSGDIEPALHAVIKQLEVAQP
ncbi:MAG: DegV family protein [Dehalococcoidia bacterium]